MNETDAEQRCDSDLEVLQRRLRSASAPAQVWEEIYMLVQVRADDVGLAPLLDDPSRVESSTLSARISEWMSPHLDRLEKVCLRRPEQVRAWLTYLTGVPQERAGLVQPVLLAYRDRHTEQVVAQLQEASARAHTRMQKQDEWVVAQVRTFHPFEVLFFRHESERIRSLAESGDGEGAARATAHQRAVARQLAALRGRKENPWR